MMWMLVLVGLRLVWGAIAKSRFDAAVAEIAARGEPTRPEDFQPDPIPDDQNAAVYYQQAYAALVNEQELTAFLDDKNLDFESITDGQFQQIEELLEPNTETFTLIRQARAHAGVDWGIEYKSPMLSILLGDLHSQRKLSKLLFLRSLLEHRKGNHAEAIEVLFDIHALSFAVDAQPMLILHLVAIGIRDLISQAVEEISHNLRITDSGDESGAVARQRLELLISELMNTRRSRELCARTLHSERAMVLDCVRLIAEQRSSMTNISSERELREDVVFAPFLPMFYLDGVWAAAYLSEYEAEMRREDWLGTHAAINALEEQRGVDNRTSVRLITHAMSNIFVPPLNRVATLEYYHGTESAMAAIALAIRLHQIDHGIRPQSLEELVPEYLPAVQHDPFAADDRPIAYRPYVPSPVLYSVSTNGVDDGGEQGWKELYKGKWSQDPDAKDLVFYLDGEQPQPPSPTEPEEPYLDPDWLELIGEGVDDGQDVVEGDADQP